MQLDRKFVALRWSVTSRRAGVARGKRGQASPATRRDVEFHHGGYGDLQYADH